MIEDKSYTLPASEILTELSLLLGNLMCKRDVDQSMLINIAQCAVDMFNWAYARIENTHGISTSVFLMTHLGHTQILFSATKEMTSKRYDIYEDKELTDVQRETNNP